MDWNYPIKDFFKLPNEKREEYLMGLAKFYYEKFVVTDSRELFDFTMNELIMKFYVEERISKHREDYERAEIFYQMIKIFNQLQEEKEF